MSKHYEDIEVFGSIAADSLSTVAVKTYIPTSLDTSIYIDLSKSMVHILDLQNITTTIQVTFVGLTEKALTREFVIKQNLTLSPSVTFSSGINIPTKTEVPGSTNLYQVAYIGTKYILPVSAAAIPSLQETIDVNKTADEISLEHEAINQITFAAGTGGSYMTDSIAALDGSVFFYGNFDGVGTSNSFDIVKMKANGTIDTTFNTGTGFDSQPYGGANILELPDGKVYVAGSFTTYNGTSANRIIRLMPDGTIDTTFNSGTGFNSLALGISVDSLDRIIVVGYFSAYNGFAAPRIARLLPNGDFDSTFVVAAGFNNTVPDVHAVSSDSLIISMYNGTYKGTTATNILRILENGDLDTTFNAGTSFLPAGNVFRMICPDPSSTSYIVVGSITSYNGTASNGIVKILSNGNIDTSFNAGTGFNGNPSRISVCYTDKFLIHGAFTAYNGIASIGAIILNADGTIFKTFTVKAAYVVNVDGIIVGRSDETSIYPNQFIQYVNDTVIPQYTQKLTFNKDTGKAEYNPIELVRITANELMPRKHIEELIDNKIEAVSSSITSVSTFSNLSSIVGAVIGHTAVVIDEQKEYILTSTGWQATHQIDLITVASYANLNSILRQYIGMHAYVTDEQKEYILTSTGWQAIQYEKLSLPHDFFVSGNFSSTTINYKTDVYRTLDLQQYASGFTVSSSNEILRDGNDLYIIGNWDSTGDVMLACITKLSGCYIQNNILKVTSTSSRELTVPRIHGSIICRGYIFMNTRFLSAVLYTKIVKINMNNFDDMFVVEVPNTAEYVGRVDGLICYKNSIYFLNVASTSFGVGYFIKMSENFEFEILFSAGHTTDRLMRTQAVFTIYNDEIYVPTVYNVAQPDAGNTIGIDVYSMTGALKRYSILQPVSTGLTSRPVPHWIAIFNGKIIITQSSATHMEIMRFDCKTLLIEETRALTTYVTDDNSIFSDGYMYINGESVNAKLWKIMYNDFTDFTIEIDNYNAGLGSPGSINPTIARESVIDRLSQLKNDIVVSTTLPDFIQVSPSSTWVVNHNSGVNRTLEFFTSDGNRFTGDITIMSINQTIGTFLTPMSGYARVI